MKVVALDIEATGRDPAADRIIELCLWPMGDLPKTYRVNPGVPIPARATAIHGIKDDHVRSAPKFAAVAGAVQHAIDGAVLLGYESRRFDVVLLDVELRRAGRKGIDLSKVQEIDVRRIWDEIEPRTLAGAAERWLGTKHPDLHQAQADAGLSLRIWQEIASRHGFGVQDGIRMSKQANEIDRAGRFLRDVDGTIVYNFGAHVGKAVKDDLKILDWIIDKADFPQETKHAARALRTSGGKSAGMPAA